VHSYFCADELFRIPDNRVPLASEHALRGLIRPLESLFPGSRVPGDEQESFEFVATPEKYAPAQPPDPEMKKDWVEWLLWEVQMRQRMARRFLNFLEHLLRIAEERRTTPIILFLREFREIKYDADAGGIHMSVHLDSDHILRDRIERMFPEYPVLWIANPGDDLSRSFIDANYVQRVNDNSILCVASEDWLESVRVLVEASDLIVMSNTKAEGGVGQEVALLKRCGALERTFFHDPDSVGLRSERLNSISDLNPKSLRPASDDRQIKVLELPPMRHWAGAESLEYGRHYVEAVDICAGNFQDLARELFAGGRARRDVSAAIYMALAALLVFRGELSAAAETQRGLATLLQLRPDDFHPYDVFAADALLESAEWYEANAEEYRTTLFLEFVEPPGASPHPDS
jgi:hypothetical protein